MLFRFGTSQLGLLLSPGGGASTITFPLSGEGPPGTPVGGQTVDAYSFYHSLYNHALAPSEDVAHTNTGAWVYRMGLQAPNGGNVFTLSSAFRLRAGTSPLPPTGSASNSEVPNPYITDPSWSGAPNIEVVQFVPDNFESINHDPNSSSGLGASIQSVLLGLIDAWQTNGGSNPNRRYVIYPSWPELSRSGNTSGDLSTISGPQKATWIAFARGAYQTWMELLHSRLVAARPTLDIRLHNINIGLMAAIADTVVSTIPLEDLFEDDAPHGRPTIYCLAGVCEYIEVYNEKPPGDFVFDPDWNVHPTVTENFSAIVDRIWLELRPGPSIETGALVFAGDHPLLFGDHPLLFEV